MSTTEESNSAARHLVEQQAQLPSSGIELRKGGNVLPTSDPKNPAINPFVQAQNQNSTQGTQPAQSGGGQGKKSK